MTVSTADELLTVFRQEVDDLPAGGSLTETDDGDCLWKDAEIYGYMTEACAALSEETRGLYRVLTRPIVAGESDVRLPCSVMDVREARIVGTDTQVQPSTANQFPTTPSTDYGLTGVTLTNTTGLPRQYVRDFAKNALRLVPTPTDDDVLELQVVVDSIAPMASGAPVPFLHPTDQNLLVMYMKYRAYQKHDAEAQDLSRSVGYYGMFKSQALDRQLALRRQRRRGGGGIKMDW
jgi:hypothetical protein